MDWPGAPASRGSARDVAEGPPCSAACYSRELDPMPRPRSIINVPRAGVSGKERMLLAALFLLAALVTGIFLWPYWPYGDSEPAPVRPPAADEEIPRVDLEPGFRSWKPPVDQLNDLIDDGTRIGRVQTSPEAMRLLAPLVKNWPHSWFRGDPERADVGGYRIATLEELSDPAHARSFRGEPVEVAGRVRAGSFHAVDPESYDLDRSEFPLPLFEGTLFDGEGREARFLMMRGSSDGLMSIPMEGRLYKLLGVFYRLTEADLDGSGLQVRPLILGTRLVEKLPFQFLDELPEDLDDRIYETEMMNIRNPPQSEKAFYEVLGYLLNKGEEPIAPEEEFIELTGLDPLLKSHEYRLKPVRVWGRVVYLARESFEYEDMRKEDAPILGYWHALLAREPVEENTLVSVILPWDAIPGELSQWAHAHPLAGGVRPVLSVEGLYYRLHAYTSRGSQNRPREVSVPLVVATRILEARLDKAQPMKISGFMWGFMGIGLVLVASIVVSNLRDRKSAKALEGKIRLDRLERRKKGGMDLNKDATGMHRKDSPP